MKTIQKVFWVSDDFLRFYNNGKDINKILNEDCNLESDKTDFHKNKITISCEVPIKKVEIDEEMFDKYIEDFFIPHHDGLSPLQKGNKMQNHLKQKLFGDKK